MTDEIFRTLVLDFDALDVAAFKHLQLGKQVVSVGRLVDGGSVEGGQPDLLLQLLLLLRGPGGVLDGALMQWQGGGSLLLLLR